MILNWLLGRPAPEGEGGASDATTRGAPAERADRPTGKAASRAADQHKLQQKLKGYHDLAKDILEKAYDADVRDAPGRALPLYNKALEAIDEGLALRVVSSGLGPHASNVAKWRKALLDWRESATARKGQLASGAASAGRGRANGGRGGRRPRPSQAVAHATTHSSPAARPQTAGPRPPWQGASKAAGPPRRNSQKQMASSAAGAVVSGVKKAAVAAVEAVKKDSDKYRQIILAEVLVAKPKESWEDIAGLRVAKQALYESVILPTLRSDLFKGLRSPPRGLLLYGPPGNGKTLLAKALAAEANATFFNISASSLTSKWVGEGEKLVRTLFEVAHENQPAIIFIDEIDSILSSRSSNENDAMRRLKTEFLVQFDGVASNSERVVVLGATNRPHELDDAARRRLVKRIYIPLPDAEARAAIIRHLFAGQSHSLSRREVDRVVRMTEGYSGSDLTALCKEASMVAIRELGADVRRVDAARVRDVEMADFEHAVGVIRPSMNREMLKVYDDFTNEFGTQ
ncbi:unnamed protein product [Ostreobium quekettii]|uniref:microtubule-severing ATPase n=1 Tax=Ostreobium quekettii TaxID=121088 RepID=A0A8S1J5J3_9CHLO|nr:unnamed protein product [Ostreobium quekettii]|eukprot:evm.model.scf_1131.2 EVM.evm.TU.scf_1131.2   scf_1131:40392-44746(+)